MSKRLLDKVIGTKNIREGEGPMKQMCTLACGILLLAGHPLVAQESAPQALVVSAENLMVGNDQHQAWVKRGGAASDVLPGDVLRYSLRFTNTQAAAVRNVVFSNPIPSGLRYVTESAAADAPAVVVTFSIDGGRTFSAHPMIEVVENGERHNVPAPARMYTHVRWTVEGWVQPGGQVTAEFRAELPEPTAEQKQ
jgi:uncharacterized repeat protein (TIGR01451 family)